RLWIKMKVRLKDYSGNWQRETLRFDTASDVTTFPAFRASQLALPIPRNPSLGARHKQTSLEIRSGYLRFQIVGMDATEFVTPCFFLGDPTVPPTGPGASRPRKLLQPLALLDQVRFALSHDAGDGTPYGKLVVEKK